MTLTQEQRDAVERRGNVKVTIDGIDCVIVRADVFDRVRTILGDDEDDTRSMYPAVLRAWSQDDDHPEDYDIYREST